MREKRPWNEASQSKRCIGGVASVDADHTAKHEGENSQEHKWLSKSPYGTESGLTVPHFDVTSG